MKIKAKEIKDYPWYLRPFFYVQKKKYGEILNSSLLWARSPKLFLGLSCLFGAIDRKGSPITPALRSLIIVRVSQLNGCVFCVDLNSFTLMQRGVSLAKIDELANWRKSPLFTDPEKVVLEYTEAVTLTGKRVKGTLFHSLQRFFDDDQIIELTAIIAFQNMSTKFNTALGVPAQGFCSFGKGEK